MRALNWEFSNRAWLFGVIFGVSFPLYALDPVNATAAVANWAAARWGVDAEGLARALFSAAALVMIAAALVRTWASAYLHAGVVYADQVKTDALIADGPYRHVRNPLYFGNVLMAIAMGAMMSRPGFVVCVALMTLFSYRLIFREEAELRASRPEQYHAYAANVPRLWPAFAPRVRPAGRTARWSDGFKAEAWRWCMAAALIAFAATLNQRLFFALLAASIALLFVSATLLSRRRPSWTANWNSPMSRSRCASLD